MKYALKWNKYVHVCVCVYEWVRMFKYLEGKQQLSGAEQQLREIKKNKIKYKLLIDN